MSVDYNTLQELLKKAERPRPVNFQHVWARSQQEMKERETDRLGKDKFYRLRSDWSNYLVVFISLMLVFQIVVTFMIGTGWLTFENYKGFLYLVVGENFAQIVGMCVIVVKFLYSKEGTKANG